MGQAGRLVLSAIVMRRPGSLAASVLLISCACGGSNASQATPAAAASASAPPPAVTPSTPPSPAVPPEAAPVAQTVPAADSPAPSPATAEAPQTSGAKTVSTKAVEIRIEGVSTASQIGTRQARKGHEFVIVETSWKNLIPLTPVAKNAGGSPVGGLSGFGTSKRPPPDSSDVEMKPTPYVVPMLRKQFWLFTDERFADTVDLEAQAATEGAFPASGFGISSLGDVVRGKLVFEVPAGARHRVFQFYDNSYGHAAFVIAGARPGAPAAAGPARQNELMQLALAGAGFSAESAPRPGLKYYSVALRGRSLLPASIVELQPNQFVFLQTDRGCVATPERNAPGLTRPMGDVGYLPPSSPNETELAFLVPDDTKHTRLLVTPAGKSPLALPSVDDFAVAWPPPRQTIADGSTLRLHVLPNPGLPPHLPSAVPGRELVMLDVVVENLKAQGVEFQGTMQLRLVDPSGGFIQRSPLSNQLACTLGDAGVIPAGHARRFQYVYDVPSDMPLKLEYRGFEKDAVVVEVTR